MCIGVEDTAFNFLSDILREKNDNRKKFNSLYMDPCDKIS